MPCYLKSAYLTITILNMPVESSQSTWFLLLENASLCQTISLFC